MIVWNLSTRGRNIELYRILYIFSGRKSWRDRGRGEATARLPRREVTSAARGAPPRAAASPAPAAARAPVPAAARLTPPAAPPPPPPLLHTQLALQLLTSYRQIKKNYCLHQQTVKVKLIKINVCVKFLYVVCI